MAGELAKDASQHGYKAYGVDIMDRLMDFTAKFDGNLPCVMQPYGTKGQGIPNNWGQAAYASTIIEVLAGEVDNSYGFKKVTISPR